MAIRDILVLIDGTERTEQRLKLACGLAAKHGAQILGLRCVDPLSPVMMYADPSAGLLIADLLQDLRAKSAEKSAVMEEAFLERLRLENVPGEWRLVEATPWDHAPVHARYTDLVVLGQPQDGDRLVEQVLFHSGRPVLVVPSAGEFPNPGKHVMIGWNASREAARAVHDALPILCAAERVSIFVANPQTGPGAMGEMPGADIARHLARHDIEVDVREATNTDSSDADMLLNEASDIGADMIVLGAYGHSRLREIVLGGVTRGVMHRMTVPVLFSH